jgi:RNA polymerase sigma factor (sigma-70 family)
MPNGSDMATSQTTKAVQHLRRAALLQDGAGLTDGELLGCFVEHRDDAAFAALVRRHGPMVWNVCRRVLGNHQDAEDAFQAAFLVLVRKAASVVPREMVANWLYGVAHQTALKARATAAKRRVRERQVMAMPEPPVVEQDPWNDLQPLLDAELSRLPDEYRAAIVLCDLEGKTRKDAARQLSLPEGTVGSRLARARGMLAKRLVRHGLALSGGAFAAVLSQKAASASVPSTVMASTIRAANLFAAGRVAASGAISAHAAALTEGVLKAMLLRKLKKAVLALGLLAIMICGGGVLLDRTAAGQEGQGRPSSSKSDEGGADAPRAREHERPEEGGYEDMAEWSHSGGAASATGIRDKGGFTVVPVESPKGTSKFVVSFAVKEEELAAGPGFRVLAVDVNGKRHPATSQGQVSAGGRGLAVVTLLPEFGLTGDDIRSFVIQRRLK